MGGDAVPPRPKYLPSGATWRPRPAEPPVGGEPWSLPSPQEPPAATAPVPRRTDPSVVGEPWT
ncbi:serine/threonine protein phosphatase, partial [Streptomyces mirabilis]